MNQFRLEDVIRHAQKIEQESHAFYAAAEPRMAEGPLRDLVRELAAAEVEHFNRLRGLLEERRLQADELASTVGLEVPSLEQLVPVRPLPQSGTARDILSVALEREKNTRTLYQRLLALTNLSAELAGILEYLVAQETGHERLIAKRLEALGP
jgi:rubrerythrin